MLVRMTEFTAAIFVAGLFYLFIIDPIYGSTIGIGEPLLQMMWEADHRFGWATNIRSWLLIIFSVIVVFIYMHLKPRLIGEDPGEYWSIEPDNDEE